MEKRKGRPGKGREREWKRNEGRILAKEARESARNKDKERSAEVHVVPDMHRMKNLRHEGAER